MSRFQLGNNKQAKSEPRRPPPRAAAPSLDKGKDAKEMLLTALPPGYKEVGLVSCYAHENKLHLANLMNTIDEAEKQVTSNLKQQCLKFHNTDTSSTAPTLRGLKVLSLPYSQSFKEKGSPGPQGILVTGFATVVVADEAKVDTSAQPAASGVHAHNILLSTLNVPADTEGQTYEKLGRVQHKCHKNKCNNIGTVFKELEREMINELEKECVKLGGQAVYNVNIVFAPYGVGPASNMEGIVATADGIACKVEKKKVRSLQDWLSEAAQKKAATTGSSKGPAGATPATGTAGQAPRVVGKK